MKSNIFTEIMFNYMAEYYPYPREQLGSLVGGIIFGGLFVMFFRSWSFILVLLVIVLFFAASRFPSSPRLR